MYERDSELCGNLDVFTTSFLVHFFLLLLGSVLWLCRLLGTSLAVIIIVATHVSSNILSLAPEEVPDTNGTKNHYCQRNQSPLSSFPCIKSVHQRSYSERNNTHKLDQNVQSRTTGILEWISDSISNNTGLVRFRSLSSGSTFNFNVLFGVIPGTSGISHHDCQHHSGCNSTGEHANQADRTNEEPDSDWRKDGVKSRKNHLFDGTLSGNSYALVRVSLSSSFAKSWNLCKLTADLNDNGTSSLLDRKHGQSSKQKW
mmetsp:Transcript_21630/g.34789  ORF Transcript_21630/g.34789 Transcript_21630/m.34789 type:complete len:257 (+) Transcript_21630:260-1030(+)